MVMIRPLWDAPALLIEKNLIVCDIHLGIEYEMYKKGIRMGSLSRKIQEILDDLLTDDITRIIFLGDVKHNIPQTSWREEVDIPNFLSFDREMIIIKGNHDGGIEELVDVEVRKEIDIHGITLTHGHRTLNQESFPSLLVVGHSHPAIEFQDELGSSMKEKCWVFGHTVKGTRVIIMPAFNPIITGVSLNREQKIPGILFSQNLLDTAHSDVFLLDGTYLGMLDSL
jgi:putative SbcD/Mre11-related phosphoesterase